MSDAQGIHRVTSHVAVRKGESKFRPKARLVSILGEHLIRDGTVGLLELVKNGYDADASEVSITLSSLSEPKKTCVVVRDDGVGMTLDQVMHAWLEPASGHKEQQKEKGKRTPKGRLPLGEKGVGRFAAQKLGRRLKLVTRAKRSDTEITVEIDWGDFEDLASYLDEIPVKWEAHEPREFRGASTTGTILEMHGTRVAWTEEDVRRLHNSLRRMMSPFKGPRDFLVRLVCPEFEKYENLESSEILDKAHFVFWGIIDDSGLLEFEYEAKVPGQERRKETDKYPLVQDIESWTPPKRRSECGPFLLRLYYWERTRSLLEASGVRRDEIDLWNGVSIFRDGIRILPYGDQDDDWLGLNARRIDKPVETISTKGLIAAVEISQKDNPDLIDKTNREGLIENQAFFDLRALVFHVISTVFEEAWLKDKPSKQVPPPAKVEEAIGKMGKEARKLAVHKESFEKVVEQVETAVRRGEKLPAAVRDLIKIAQPLAIAAGTLHAATEEVRATHKQVAEEFDLERDVLLGMAGLGLAAERFTHEFARLTREASQSLKQIRSSISQASPTALRHVDALDAALAALRNDILALGPLFYIRRPSKEKPINVRKAVDNALLLNRMQILDAKIHEEVRDKAPLTVMMREGQCTQVINNLVDNAVFWLSRKSQENDRHLRIVIDGSDHSVLIADNGPGVLPKYRDRLFQPFFSTKPDARAEGRGLGLYISRETLKHVGATLNLVSSDTDQEAFSQGAAFKIQFPPPAAESVSGR